MIEKIPAAHSNRNRVKPGDILITGRNFGTGSSCQHAADCFRALGITAVIAQSFGTIYESNAINSAFSFLLARIFLITALRLEIKLESISKKVS